MFDVYKPSGSVGILTYPLVLIGVVFAILMAFIYHLCLSWIPFIYLNFLASIGMGMGLGKIGSFAVTKGQCRNLLLAGVIGILLATAGLGAKYWFQHQSVLHTATAMIRQDPTIPEADRQKAITEFQSAFTIGEYLRLRANQGWQIGRGGRLPIAGIFVYLVWLIEAGFFYYCAVIGTWTAAGQPFSEKNHQWANESQVVMTLPVTDPAMVAKIQSATSVADLLTIPIPQTDQSNRFAVYTVNSIPGQELEDAYLSVSNVTISVNNKGEQETNTTMLVKHAILSSANRNQLIENAELLQEALADFRSSKNAEEIEAESVDDVTDTGQS